MEVEKLITSSGKKLPKGRSKPFSVPSLKKSFKFSTKAMRGGALGALTFPLYIKSMKNLSSDDPKKRMKGLGGLAAQTMTYSALKGATEHGARVYHGGLTSKKALSKLKKSNRFAPHIAGALSKGSISLLKNLGPAAVIAAGMRKGKGGKRKKSNPLKAGLLGGLFSAGIGTAERAAFMKKMHGKVGRKAVRELAAAGGGKFAAGALSTVLLDKLIRKVVKKDSK